MKLYLMRHGDYVTDDILQKGSLSEKGKQDVGRLAHFLNTAKLHAAEIFHSGKPRAEQTAAYIAKAIKTERPPVSRQGLEPLDDVTPLARELASYEDDLFIVGHLPFMGRLVSKLVVGDDHKEIVNFEAGSIVCLEKIESERWVIAWVLSPALFLSHTAMFY